MGVFIMTILFSIFGLLVTLAMVCLGLILVGTVGSVLLFVFEWTVKIVIVFLIVEVCVKIVRKILGI